jgi:CRISP-associated protein Cas1
MIKRTLYFGNPAYLCLKLNQLELQTPNLPAEIKKYGHTTIPIEDIGLVMLDHHQISISQPLLNALIENNVALISCDACHMPIGLWLPLEKHNTQHARQQAQIAASLPLKKNLWAQIIAAKLYNQASVLALHQLPHKIPERLAQNIKSGDAGQAEAQGAAHYWKHIGQPLGIEKFVRERAGTWPNAAFNYGYAIVRAMCARALVGSGLLPTFGLYHHNQYNAYCLADDLMEPYRPILDRHLLDYLLHNNPTELSQPLKIHLLGIASVDVNLDGQTSPLLNALSRSSASLAQCYEGNQKKLLLPSFVY